MLSPIRPNIVKFIHGQMNKNSRQPYAVFAGAGHQHSAESWGTGRAVSRIPRVSGGGTSRAGQGAFGNMCRSGRMFAPTKTWRKWHFKISQKQKRYATASAIAATAVPALVEARGHRIGQVPEIPLVVDNSFESLTKTKDAIDILTKLGAYEDVLKAKKSKHIRAGKGKMRNRRYVTKKGPLIVYDKNDGICKAVRNLPGVDVCQVNHLNVLNVAPGGTMGRFIIWTESAFHHLNKNWGTWFKGPKRKRDFCLPRPIMTNPDLHRLINSQTVQERCRRKQKSARKAIRKKNPLKNFGIMVKLNPYAMTLRRSEILAAKKRANEKNKKKDYSAKKAHEWRKKINFLRISTGRDVHMTKEQHDRAVALANKRRGRGKKLYLAKLAREKAVRDFKKTMRERKKKYIKEVKEMRAEDKAAREKAKEDGTYVKPEKGAINSRRGRRPKPTIKQLKRICAMAKENRPKKKRRKTKKRSVEERWQRQMEKNERKKRGEAPVAVAPTPKSKTKKKKAAKAPAAKAPAAKAPETKAPETKAPETKAPAAEAPAAEAPAAEAPEAKVVPATVSTEPEVAQPFKTYDNDNIMGKQAPVEHIRNAKYLQGTAPAEGSNLLVLLWRKSYKSGYKFMPLYSALHEKFKDQNLEVVGVCVDRDKDAAEGFLKKYHDGPKGNFTTTFAICEEWSPANKLYPLKARPIEKGFLDNMMDLHPGMKEMPSIPHSFLINSNNTIVWHQDHSERGQAAPDHMEEVEEQCKRLLSGSMLMSLGSKVVASSDSSEDSSSDSDGDEKTAAADMGDFFTSL